MKINNSYFSNTNEGYRVSFEASRSGGVVVVKSMASPETVNVSGAIVVNDVDISFTATFYPETGEVKYLMGHRLVTFTDLTDAAVKFLKKELIPTAATTALADAEFQADQQATYAKYLGYDIERAQNEIASLEQKANEKRQEIADLQKKLFELTGSYATR